MKTWNDFSYKRKNQLLWLGSLLFLFIAYQFAFSKTINAYRNYRYFKNNSQQSAQIKDEQALLNARASKLDQTFSSGSDTLQFRDNILTMMSDFAARNNLLVTAVPESGTIITEGNMIISHASFFIEGAFADLVRLANEIEKNIAFARVSSASFALKVDPSGSPSTVVLKMQISKIKLGKN